MQNAKCSDQNRNQHIPLTPRFYTDLAVPATVAALLTCAVVLLTSPIVLIPQTLSNVTMGDFSLATVFLSASIVLLITSTLASTVFTTEIMCAVASVMTCC
jgi:hypothetical protein